MKLIWKFDIKKFSLNKLDSLKTLKPSNILNVPV